MSSGSRSDAGGWVDRRPMSRCQWEHGHQSSRGAIYGLRNDAELSTGLRDRSRNNSLKSVKRCESLPIDACDAHIGRCFGPPEVERSAILAAAVESPRSRPPADGGGHQRPAPAAAGFSEAGFYEAGLPDGSLLRSGALRPQACYSAGGYDGRRLRTAGGYDRRRRELRRSSAG
jgi:hypothetical protein